MKKGQIFRYLCWFICIYHLVLGFLGLLFPLTSLAPLITQVYGVTPVIDSQFIYLAKFISAYFIAFGAMMGLVGYKPYRYRDFALIGAALFIIRVFTRIYFFSELQTAFVGITMEHNMLVSLPITLLALCLLALRPKNEKETHQ